MIPLFFTLSYFNSHAHVERDLQSDTFHNDLVISTHTLTWSVTGEENVIALFGWNFNSHAHVERDLID